MTISIITLFPEMFPGVFNSSILHRAQEKGKLTLNLVDLREYGIGKHKSVDDKPYGGGAGMVLRIDVLTAAIRAVKAINPTTKVYLLDPKGKPYNQELAEHLSQENDITLICGHYEGVDGRIYNYIDGEISIGDFVLTGGEIPAMAVVDSIVRLIPGVLGKDESSHFESFSNSDGIRKLEHDHYTRPDVFEGHKVPEELLSGDPKIVNQKRSESADKNTLTKRPDLR